MGATPRLLLPGRVRATDRGHPAKRTDRGPRRLLVLDGRHEGGHHGVYEGEPDSVVCILRGTQEAGRLVQRKHRGARRCTTLRRSVRAKEPELLRLPLVRGGAQHSDEGAPCAQLACPFASQPRTHYTQAAALAPRPISCCRVVLFVMSLYLVK